jgi:hypothetical protein
VQSAILPVLLILENQKSALRAILPPTQIGNLEDNAGFQMIIVIAIL